MSHAAVLGQQPGIWQPCTIFMSLSSDAAAVKSQQCLAGGFANITAVYITVMLEMSSFPPALESDFSAHLKCLLGATTLLSAISM